jgi:hypothetical protein
MTPKNLTPYLVTAMFGCTLLACTKEEAAPAEKAPAAAEVAAPAATTGISPQKFADGLHAVMKADRTVYTKKVVNRLQNEEDVIKASEHWEDDKALPLPAQMFRMGAEMASNADAGFT